MAGVTIQVIYDPDGDNIDISGSVIFRTVRLNFAAASLPGTWEATITDPNRELDFTTGKRVIWKLNDQVLYGGFLTQINRGFAFPVVDTSDLNKVTAKQFVLRGVDYNILFDKRVLRNPANYLSWIPRYARSWDKTLIAQLCDDYLDLPGWIDTSTHVEQVSYLPRAASSGTFKWVTQGSPWRKQMEVFTKYTGAICYLRPSATGADLVYKAIENADAPYVLSDQPSGDEKGFRELDYSEDASGMVNDALVWGGDEFGSAETQAPTVFNRTKNDTSIADHGRWQWAETHFGDPLYASEATVQDRAEAIVLGRTGDTIHQQNRGLQNPNKSYSLTWFHKDVPQVAGVYQFIYPGDLTTLNLWVMGDGFNPLSEVLPCRQVTITFPSLDPVGDAYAKFTGTFSLQVNDPWQLWQAIKRRTIPA